MKLINKSALVAEIKRRKEINKYRDTNDSLFEDEAILFFIDTLEVKEVDLEKEIDYCIETFLTGTNPIYTKGGISCIIDKTAKHFFELGLKAARERE